MRGLTEWAMTRAAGGRVGAIALCLALAACQSGSSGGGSGSSSAPAAFTPGQAVEVLGVDGGPIPEGQCRDVQRTAWVTAIEEVSTFASEDLEADKEQLACDAAMQAWETSAAQKCSTQFNDGQLYRNGYLLPVGQSGARCACRTVNNRSICDVQADARCAVEVLRTDTVEACR